MPSALFFAPGPRPNAVHEFQYDDLLFSLGEHDAILARERVWPNASEHLMTALAALPAALVRLDRDPSDDTRAAVRRAAERLQQAGRVEYQPRRYLATGELHLSAGEWATALELLKEGEQFCENHDLRLGAIDLHLAAIRVLFDWLVVGQIVPSNPTASVRGPKPVVKTGKTPVLTPNEARHLLGSIDTSTVVGLRDRAVIATMIYTVARVGAAVAMSVEDYYQQGKRWWVRLHEKGGKRHDVPAHHSLEEVLDAYLITAGTGDGKTTPLFRTVDRCRRRSSGAGSSPATRCRRTCWGSTAASRRRGR